MKSSFLILDDDTIFSETLARALTRRNFDTTVTHNGEEALQAAQKIAFDYVTVDLHLVRDSGLQWITPLREALPKARILILTGYASIATAIQAVKLGADDYLAKPANVDAILSALSYASHSSSSEPDGIDESTPAPFSVARLEWEHIHRVLLDHQGNISSAARALNMHRRTLQRKLAKKPPQK